MNTKMGNDTETGNQNGTGPHPTEGSPITVDHIRDLLVELEWFYTRDWPNIASDRKVAQALSRRSTRAALYAEDIRTDILIRIQGTNIGTVPAPDATPIAAPSQPTQELLIPTTEPPEQDDPPSVTTIPLSVDRVEIFDFGTPHEHEHPLYKDHNVMHFCAAFYHEEEFIFARAHLQLLLTPAGILNWLAGARSVPIDRNFLPLPYLPEGELFNILGRGITQLIYANQTELKLRMKQGHRFPLDYKLTAMVIPTTPEPSGHITVRQPERQRPLWVKA